MSNFAKVQWLGKPINTEINLPASKSISNRLLIMKHLAEGQICIENLSSADDTRLMTILLANIAEQSTKTGSEEKYIIDCANAGTVFRFLTAVLAISPGKWFITGSERMKQRPVGPLVDSLLQLGAKITYAGEYGYPPLNIEGKVIRGGNVLVEASMSSQYLSALLLIGPTMQNGLTIIPRGETVSRPYAEMTVELLKKAGVKISSESGVYAIQPGLLSSAKFIVEPDWSSASYWFELASMVAGSRVLLKGLKSESLQGDRVLMEIFEKPGVKTDSKREGILIENGKQQPESLNFDFSHYPDLVPAVAATCAALNITAQFSGLAHLRIKESDRIKALVHELKKINNSVSVRNENEIIIGKQSECLPPQCVSFNTYGDHRLAMALAPLAVFCEYVLIENPEVVDKSYPGFWTDLQNSGFLVEMH